MFQVPDAYWLHLARIVAPALTPNLQFLHVLLRRPLLTRTTHCDHIQT